MSKNDKSKTPTNKSQNEFFASAIHELRTPLTAIHGYSELLTWGDLEESEIKLFSQIIQRNSAYVLRLVNGLLDLSKINSGNFKLHEKRFNLITLLKEIEEVCQPRAKEKNISFTIEWINPVVEQIFSDETRLKQVLLNLANNAVKFTKEGGVKIIFSFDALNHTLSFKVVDTGIGLSDEQKNRLFSAFVQADLSINKKFGGTGLGLVVSKEIVSKMGGSLEVSSETGIGSVFSVSLPIKKDSYKLQTTPRKKINKISTAKVPILIGTVLIIEDAPDTRSLVKYLLEKTGAQVTTAENGEIGLNLAKEKEFDLILLDKNLPVVSGELIAKELRKGGYGKPIVAFSADRGSKNKNWIKEAKLSGSIPKPFTNSQLFKVAKKHLMTVSDVLNSNTPIQSTLLNEGDEYKSIVSNFVAGLPKRLENIQFALTNNCLETVVTESHKLCSAQIFGFPLLGKIARLLESAASNDLKSDIALHFAKLEGVIKRIGEGLQK